MHEDLLSHRADHPGLASSTYLANHTLGAAHRGSAEGVARWAAEWVDRGIRAWETWEPEVARVGDLAGALIGAPPGSTVLRASVHDALGDIASALPLADRPRVLLSQLEWPGTRYLWQQTAGAELVEVTTPAPGGVVDLGPLAAAVDDRTAAVFLSLVFFRTSSLVDPTPVVEAARRHGALVVLDAYQAAGAVPVDVTALDVDVCVGGSVKFLCGGPGNGCSTSRRAPCRPSRRGATSGGGVTPSTSPSTRSGDPPRGPGGTPGGPPTSRPPTPPPRRTPNCWTWACRASASDRSH